MILFRFFFLDGGGRKNARFRSKCATELFLTYIRLNPLRALLGANDKPEEFVRWVVSRMHILFQKLRDLRRNGAKDYEIDLMSKSQLADMYHAIFRMLSYF